MIKVSHKELKEIQKRKKKDEGEIAEEGPRLTGEKISHLEERELTLMKQLKSENDKKLSEPDAKFCICQRVAKSVSLAVLNQKAKITLGMTSISDNVPMRALSRMVAQSLSAKKI